MKHILFIFFVTVFAMKAHAQNFANDLYHAYGNYLERSIQTRRFPPDDYLKLMEQFVQSGLLSKENLGRSVSGRELNLYRWGRGETRIFLWSQMHGDEATASLALLDIFHFLADTHSFRHDRQIMHDAVSLYILPLVNPDGADDFTRRNSIAIDLNRDALRLTTPEARILMETYLRLKPHYAFNLHDQQPRYSAGNSHKVAAISFLAPAPDQEKTITPNRLLAMKVISGMTEVLNKIIPGHTAKYDDTFEPRAFGDNFQKLGGATILIESGGWPGDPEKQFIRKLNFIIMLEAFHRISRGGVELLSTELYEALPFNDTRLFDVIYRNCSYLVDGQRFTVDIAVNRYESVQPDGKLMGYSEVEEIGDLSVFYGMEEYDFSGYEITAGSLPEKLYSIQELTPEVVSGLHKQGFHTVRTNARKLGGNFSKLGVNLILNSERELPDRLMLNRNASFVVRKDSKPIYLVINGYLLYPSTGAGFVRNGTIIK